MTGYLLVTGILFLLFGLRALFNPIDAVATPYSLGADNIDAKNYLRSGAGGVTIASATVMIAGAFVPALSLSGVVLGVVILGGLVVGRVVSVLMDGSPGVVAWVSGILELIGASVGGYWLCSLL